MWHLSCLQIFNINRNRKQDNQKAERNNLWERPHTPQTWTQGKIATTSIVEHRIIIISTRIWLTIRSVTRQNGGNHEKTGGKVKSGTLTIYTSNVCHNSIRDLLHLQQELWRRGGVDNFMCTSMVEKLLTNYWTRSLLFTCEHWM